MLKSVFLWGYYFEIFNPIIFLFSVYMMNEFKPCQFPTKMIFHH